MTGRNCKTCGVTQVGSCIVVPVHLPTWRRLFEPVANPIVPPPTSEARGWRPAPTLRRGRSCRCARGRTRCSSTSRLGGSAPSVSAIPEIMPRSFFTGQTTPLLGPPSVPRSVLRPSSHRVACWVMSPERFEVPDAQPRSFRLLPELTAPPSDGRFVTMYAGRPSSSDASVGPADEEPASRIAAIRNRAFTPYIEASL